MRRSRFGQGGAVAAVVAIVAAAASAIVGVAGAQQRAAADTVYTSEVDGQCFSTDDTTHTCTPPASPADVSIATGQTVDFAFPGNPGGSSYSSPHNVVSNSPNWSFVSDDATGTPRPPVTTPPFNEAGDYLFVCGVHPGMTGTIHVTGPTITATPTPTVSSTPTPTPTPSTQPSGGPQTPPPAQGTDTVKPTVRRVKLKAQYHAARITFTLSESATVTIRVKRGSKVLKTVRVQAHKGTRTVKIRSSKLKKGSYTIELRARDAGGNTSSLAKKRLRIAR